MRNLKKNASGIQAIVEKKGDAYIGFILSGHAGFAPRGKDIVCSAVSMISIQLVNAVETLTTSKALVDEKDGYLKYRLTEYTEEAQLLFQAFVLGLEMIMQEYGNEYIQIEYKEV